MNVSTKYILMVLLRHHFKSAKFIFKWKKWKNALSEVYYNLILQVLSDEYTDYVGKINDISDVAAAVNLDFQKTIRSNELKRGKDKENLKKTRIIYLFLKRINTNLKKRKMNLSKASKTTKNFLCKSLKCWS